MKSLIKIKRPICDNWIVIDNLDISADIIARGKKEIDITIENSDIGELIKLSK